MAKHTIGVSQQKQISLFGCYSLTLLCLLIQWLEVRPVAAVIGNEYVVGYCAPYHGKVCKSFITSTQVWYNKVSQQRPKYHG